MWEGRPPFLHCCVGEKAFLLKHRRLKLLPWRPGSGTCARSESCMFEWTIAGAQRDAALRKLCKKA